MIAYNYNLKFVPSINDDEIIDHSSHNTLVVRKIPFISQIDGLDHKLIFTQNQGRDVSLLSNKAFALISKEQRYAFEIKNVVTFFWNQGEPNINYMAGDFFTIKLMEYWLLHTLLPIYFTMENTYSLFHAGSVEVDGKPILFTAPSFGGKSTMTDYFIQQGHIMLSDDMVPTFEHGGHFFALASYPFHRPYRKTEDLGYRIDNVTKTPKPLHAIYELVATDPDSPIEIIQLRGINKFKTLRYGSEVNFPFLTSLRFEYLVKMSNAINVFQIQLPWDIKRLNEVYNMIINHSKTLN